MKKDLLQTLKILIAAIILSFSISAAYAWVAPTQTPPNGNVAAPINTGATNQVKTGGLGVGAFTANSAQFNGNVTATGKLTVGGGGVQFGDNTVQTTAATKPKLGNYTALSYTGGGSVYRNIYEYTASTDGFVVATSRSTTMYGYVNGVLIVTDGSPDYPSIAFPVSKGDSWKVYIYSGGSYDASSNNVQWIPLQ